MSRPNVTIAWLIERLEDVRETRTGWMARCPAHDDDTPSLSFRVTQDAVILMHCFAGCDTEDVCAALGIEVHDLWPDSGGNGVDRSHGGSLRTRGVIWERVRPIRWLWERRIPCGLPSLIVGEEDIGKGTVMAWVVARATLGELPGDLTGEPINVLVVGDEDGFESIWVPRIHAAGGDLDRVLTLDDGEYLEDFSDRAADLAVTIERDDIGLIVLDQLLDHVAAGKDGSGVYNPKAVRKALLPLRRVTGSHGIAAVGLLHPVKGASRVSNFRDLIAGSHQFNAVSRSSLLLGKAPEDEHLRVLVRGKGNHSAAPRSFEFRIGIRTFDLNQHRFEMPVVEDAEEGSRTIDDMLKPHAPVATALAEQLAGHLTGAEQSVAGLARAVGRDPKDGSIRNALNQLAKDNRATKGEHGWRRFS